MSRRNILVTGGAGYIASHVVLELIEAGYSPVILDNFSNSNPLVIKRLEKLSGQSIPYVEGDCRDVQKVDDIFKAFSFYGVMHFAGLKA